MNWYVGWSLLLAAFCTGAGVGLFFHRDDFLGGYASFRRRMLRLGHISCAALGMLNLIYALAPARNNLAALLLVAGGITMPIVCFLTAWRSGWRHLFFIPVVSLVTAVVMALCGRGEPPACPSPTFNTRDAPAAHPYNGDQP